MQNEEGSVVKIPLECHDGNDNDCDGVLPVVELDCDDDGSMPRLPQPRPWVTQASQLGLRFCDTGYADDVEDIRSTLTCLATTATDIVCDRTTDLWRFVYDMLDDDCRPHLTQR